MKKPLSLLLAVISLAAFNPTPFAQTAEEWIESHIKAIGGKEAHKKITTRVMKGTFDLKEQNFSGAKLTIQSKAPNKFRSEVDIPGVGKFTDGYDGKRAWGNNPFSGTEDKPEDQQKAAKRQADFYRDVELIELYESWTLKGKQDLDGKPAVVLVGKSKDGAIDTLYLDPETKLIRQIDNKDENNSTVVKLSEYKEIDGVKLPHSILMNAGEIGSISITISEVKHGVEMADSLFVKPTN